MVDLPRNASTGPYPDRPSWWADAGGLVHLCCTNGHIGVLLLDATTGHTVAADGAVAPSCVCPRAGCGWHEYVRLVGWTG